MTEFHSAGVSLHVACKPHRSRADERGDLFYWFPFGDYRADVFASNKHSGGAVKIHTIAVGFKAHLHWDELIDWLLYLGTRCFSGSLFVLTSIVAWQDVRMDGSINWQRHLLKSKSIVDLTQVGLLLYYPAKLHGALYPVLGCRVWSRHCSKWNASASRGHRREQTWYKTTKTSTRSIKNVNYDFNQRIPTLDRSVDIS